MKRVLVFIGFLILMALCANSLQAQDLRDSWGRKIGQVKSDGYVYDQRGNIIGHVDSDGDVFDQRGNKIGKVDRDGYAYDQWGNLIGSAEGVDRKITAIYFFFNFFEQE